MSSFSRVEIRRCRPLLGTYVELTVEHAGDAAAHEAAGRAFAEIATVHRLMSAHDPESDLARIQQDGLATPVEVDPRTHEVLALAARLHAESDGVFDVTVGSELARRGLLPALPLAEGAGRGGDVRLHSRHRVSLRRPARLDLGGIAKGYAVDRAVSVLRHCGARAGLVNAGGDLRCFGPTPRAIAVRPPDGVGLVPLPPVRDVAVATSSHVPGRGIPALDASPHVHGGTREPVVRAFGVTVFAPRCVLADALTKVVLATGRPDHPLLARHGAWALLVPAAQRATDAAQPAGPIA